MTAPHVVADRDATPRTHLPASLRAARAWRAAPDPSRAAPNPSRAAPRHEGLNAAALRTRLAHPLSSAPPCVAPPPAQACRLSQTGLPLPAPTLLPPPPSLAPAAAATATGAILAVTERVRAGLGSQAPITGRGWLEGAGDGRVGSRRVLAPPTRWAGLRRGG